MTSEAILQRKGVRVRRVKSAVLCKILILAVCMARVQYRCTVVPFPCQTAEAKQPYHPVPFPYEIAEAKQPCCPVPFPCQTAEAQQVLTWCTEMGDLLIK